MEVEVETLILQMSEDRTREIARMTFHEGRIGDREVVVVRSGIGKVNAGMCVQILKDVFDVTHIINTGVAGSLDSRINIGDIVVSKEAMYYDVDATVFGYQKGEVPQLGMVTFPADGMLCGAAAAAAAKAAPEIRVFEGLVISGDQFIADREKNQELIREVGGLCTEMEGAAIAHAATLNEIPFVIIRAISDKADISDGGETAVMSYEEFEAKAAAHCAAITGCMLKTI